MATTLGSKSPGSIVKLNENGSPVDFYVAKQNYESGLNGDGRVLVVRKDIYENHQWHTSDVNAYGVSDIDKWLNGTYKNLLDAKIRTAMSTTMFYYITGNGSAVRNTLRRSVFILSFKELGRDISSNLHPDTEGTTLPIAATLQIAYLDGSKKNQWTRSPNVGTTDNPTTTTRAYLLDTKGNLVQNICSSRCGVRPAFTLPSSLYVNDDGVVFVNTAPAVPGSITIHGTVYGGSTITVSWVASTDAEGNLEGYKVERSTDGGSSWTQIYQGSARSTTNSVAFGTETVMYRVKACDSEGLESGWRTSAQATVINNTAPTAPASITVPETVLGGGTLTVTWGAASDPDYNLTGYELERQVDGGEWAQVYKGANTSYTDNITRGWASVNYRVRACDAYNAASGYTTGTARTVNNNRAPTVNCAAASGSNMGTKSAEFDLAYSVGDEDGDSVSVTEAIDGVELRTFTAALNEENTFVVAGDTFFKLLNGAHVLTATVSDGKASAVHKLTFTKSVTAASITLAEPMEADDKITICVLSVAGDIPADAEYQIEVTNNALDDAPVWEDCTVEVRNGGNHIFTNETAANGFAFNFRLTVERGASGVGGYISSVQGGFQ